MAQIIEDIDMEIEIDESVGSENSANVEEDEIFETVKTAMKMMDAKKIVKIITYGANLLSSMENGAPKVPRPQTDGQLKARAWEKYVLERCQRDGWGEFTHESKTGKVTQYAGAGLSEDGKVVFCDTGKPFMNKHAKIYASMVRETEWYADFELQYVPSDVVAKPKMSAEEKEAEKKRKAEEAAAAKEAEKQRRAAERQAEKERKLEEKRIALAAEEAKKREGLAKIKVLVPPVIPVAKPKAAVAAPVVKAAPKPVEVKPVVSVVKKVPAKKVTWVKPANGEMGEFEISGHSYWRDADDYLFENHNGEVGEFAGQFVNGKIDDSVENPFQ